jgi:anaerobic selenocysteine-containing dehydrogenase
MGQWHKTGCVLCAQNCGLELYVEDGRITRARPDRDNLRSKGYACRKGLNIVRHQYPADRLTRPLKRVGDRFEPVSWDTAMDEIAARLKGLLAEHGPRCLAYMGGGSTGGHMEAGFGLGLLRGLGSKYYYSTTGQEFSGAWWVNGRMFGRQYAIPIPDEHASDMIVGWGWNGMESHQMPRAPIVLKEFSANPDKTLVIVDPRKSETAAIADIHLAVRPGTDALLVKAMIALILRKGWENTAYLDAHVDGWERIRPWFEGFDVRGALSVCELDEKDVEAVCRLMTCRKWCLHPDLGIYMGRHSTLNSYLLQILGVVCGIFGVRGGNVFPGSVMPMGSHADERDPKTWRTMATGMPPVAAGAFPPAVVPEEILAEGPDRLRAVILSAVNPLRSYPDTKAYEKAFRVLDLLVVSDIALTETARLAHYVLPCRTYYESWDVTFFPWTYPDIYFQLRRPVVDPPEQCREAAQISTMLADRMGLVPDIPDTLKDAAKQDRMTFGMALMTYAGEHPEALARMPYVMAKTLGAVWDSAAMAGFWGLLMTAPKTFVKNARRAGFEPGLDLGDRIFQALLDAPEGITIGRADTENMMADIKTPSGKIEVFIPEMEDRVVALTPENESRDLVLPMEFPFVLNAGRHMRYNANTMMRDPGWNGVKRACTVAVNPADALRLTLSDGGRVRVLTENGCVEGDLEVTDRVRRGTVLIPHGFGLNYDGTVYGFNANELTKNTHRDPLGTPIHRFVPCRIEAV